MTPPEARERILELARAEGFELVRFAPARPLVAARAAAQTALASGHLDGMAWITRDWLDRSTDPARFLPGARTVILFALPYGGGGRREEGGVAPVPRTSVLGPQSSRGRVAAYARGRDYHRVFETKLRRIVRAIRDELGAEARATVDYGPLLERPLAIASGMGWRGKSTMLLAPGFGPWLLLGAIATSLEIAPDPPLRKTCGGCTRCLVACPTGALSPDGHVLDARLCISYHTIENRGPIPRELRPQFGDRIFGCDECLDACPVGAARFACHPDFEPASLDDAFPPLAELLSLDEAAFTERFRGRAIRRARRDGLLRNACVALGNVGTAGDLPALIGALADVSPLVRGHAAWGATRLATRLRLSPREPVLDALNSRLAIESDAFVREELILAVAESRTVG